MEAFLQSHWFPDVLIIVVILLFGFIKGHKGFFKCVIPVVILAIALVGSYFLTPYVEPVAQEKLMPFVEKKVIEKLDQKDLDSVGDLSKLLEKAEREKTEEKKDISAEDQGLAESIMEKLPAGVKELVEKYGVNVGETLKEKISDIKIGNGAKEQVTNGAAALITAAASKAIYLGCYVVVALLLLLVLNIIKAILNPLFSKAPVISQANKTAGFMLGVIEAIFIIYLAVCIMKVFNLFDIATRAKGTYLLKAFMSIDPSKIVDLILKN